MRKTFAILLLIAAAVGAVAPPALARKAAERRNIQVAVEVRAGTLYDYVLIGMNQAATDGLDNAYDTVAPGMGVGDRYILMTVPHPDWKAVKADFRTDFRAVKKSDTWVTMITTNFPDGTPLTMSIDREQSKLVPGYAVIVEDMATGTVQDLAQGAYVFPVKTSGIARECRITIRKVAGNDPRNNGGGRDRQQYSGNDQKEMRNKDRQ